MSSDPQEFDRFEDRPEETRSKFVRPVKGRSKTSSAVMLVSGTSSDLAYLEGEFEEINVDKSEVIPPANADTLPTENEEGTTPCASPALSRALWPRFKGKPLLVVCLIAALLLVGVSTILAFAFLAPTATITIIPVRQDLQSTAHITAVTGTPNGAEIQATSMSETSTSNTLTVNATGIQYTPGVAAKGTITLYNSAPYPQTVVPGSGTIITGTDGVEVQLDSVVTVPKGNPPNSYGIAQVPAHALVPGAHGNIAAGDIYAPCCANYIVASNETAFNGGVDAQPYHVVAQADVDSAVGTLKGSLSQQVQSALTAKLSAGLQLGLVTSCTQQPHTQPAVGDKAESVSVSLSMSCTGIAYNENAASQQATTFALHEAAHQFPAYTLLKTSFHVSFEPAVAVTDNPSAISVSVHTQGTWVYPLSVDSIQRLVAGKQIQDARALLSRVPGVQRYDLSVNVPLPVPWWNASVLPTALDHIRVIVQSAH